MCGRFGLTRPDKLDLNRFGVGQIPRIFPRFNIPPGGDVLVIRERRSARVADLVRWGLIPSWAKEKSAGNRMANARAETALARPAFRNAMERRRCLVPADVFFEWQSVPGSRRKQPWAFALPDGEIFALGALWDFWRPQDGGEGVVSCAILTTEPNLLMEPIHDRMPVIIAPEAYDGWLNPVTPMGAVQEMVRPWPSGGLRAWRISLAINDPKNDDSVVLLPSDADS